MKKQFLSILFCLLTTLVFSQKNIGLNIGILRTNNESIQTPDNPNLLSAVYPQWGGHIGVYRNYGLKNKISLQINAGYELSGYKWLTNPSLNTYKNYYMHYLFVMPKIRYQSKNFILSGGPKVSALLYVPYYSTYQKIELALNGELGYDFKKFICTFSYHYALTPYANRYFLGTHTNYKNRNLSLSVEIPLK